MAATHDNPLLRHIHRLLGPPAEEWSDGRLLDRFLARRDEAAFAALVQRHGPMVFGLCRRVLHNEHDAEDAFQATFLVLARKAASVRNRRSLGGWLHEVAYHIALRARIAAARREVLERQVRTMTPMDPVAELARRELRPVLDEELRRLPDKYREPLILCYLEGKTNEDAARQLGWPIGSMSRRLARGRDLLRRRLLRRGVALSVGMLAAALAEETAAVPSAVAASVARTAVRISLEGFAAGAVSPSVSALAEAGMRALVLNKARMALVLLLAVVGAGAGALAYQSRAEQPSARRAGENSALLAPAVEKPIRVDQYGDPLPPGALARLGTIRLRHRSPELAFAADGKTVISVGDDKTVRRWQTATGKEARRTRLQGAEPFTLPLALTLDGKTVAGAQTESLRVWDATSGKEVWSIAVGKVQVPRLVFSPDGKVLAAVLYDLRKHDIHLWETATGKEIACLPHDQFADRLAFSPDGNLLATVVNNILRLWDVAAGKEVRKVPGWRCMAFSPDGKKIAAGNDAGRVKIWDVATGRESAVFGESSPQAIFFLTFAPGGTTLAVGLQENVSLWDVTARKRLRTIAARGGQFVFAPDGKTLATSTMSAIHLWDVTTGREIGRRPGHDGDVSCLAVSPDGQVLASISWSDREVRLWGTTSGKPLSVAPGHRYAAHTCVFSADGKSLISGGDGGPRLWDAKSGQEMRKFSIETSRPTPSDNIQVTALALSPGGDRLAALSSKGDPWENYQIDVWDAATGKHRMHRSCPPDFRASFAPDGESIAIHTQEGFVLQDTARGRELLKIPGNVCAPLAFSPHGQILAVTSFKPKSRPPGTAGPAGGDPAEADAVYLVELATGKQLLRIETGPVGLDLLAYSPDGRLLATADRDCFRIWDVATGKKVFQRALPDKHHGPIGYSFATSLAFLPGGDRLATGLMDGTVLIWDLEAKTWHAGMDVKDLNQRDLEALWADLASGDGGKAHRAVWTLAALPAKAVPFLKEHLHPVLAEDAKQLQRLIADLDSPEFAIREEARRKLASFGEQAEPALRRSLAGKPSLEVRKRLETLLADAETAGRGIVRSPEVLRMLRAIRVLEHIGTGEAREILQTLAAGDPAARPSREAKEAERRLIHRAPSMP